MKRCLTAVLALILMLSLAACSQQAKNVDLKAVMTDIDKNVGGVSDMLTLDASTLMQYYGIDAADCKQYVVRVNDSGIKAQELAMLEGKDSASTARIKEKVQARLDSFSNQYNGYLPEEYDIVKKSSVKVSGNYVSLFVSPDADKMISIYNSYVK